MMKTTINEAKRIDRGVFRLVPMSALFDCVGNTYMKVNDNCGRGANAILVEGVERISTTHFDDDEEVRNIRPVEEIVFRVKG